MASTEEIRNTRLEKLEKIRKSGMDPYPSRSMRDYTLSEAVAKFPSISKGGKGVTLSGRVMSIRPHGSLVFFDVNDGTGSFQGLIKKDDVRKEDYDLFLETVDMADFIEIEGSLFLTKRDEKTMQVKSWRMLAKALRQLPEKWHGLQDVEEKFRRRYLDLLANNKVKERFLFRSRLITEIRRHLDGLGFIEVETPILQSLAGGANAFPFVTHHNALDIDLYLRIAPELYLKKLLIGGFAKVYEIGRNFRNEGIDVTHNPEFTMLEYYEAYSDAEKQMAFAESFLGILVEKFFSSKTLDCGGIKIDFGKPFVRIQYYDLLERTIKLNGIADSSRETIRKAANDHGLSLSEDFSKEKMLDEIFKRLCRPKLIQPTFVTDYPVGALPLAKRSIKDKNLVEAFQVYTGGFELVKAFSELNDPLDQRSRFVTQDKEKDRGDREAQSTDEEFIEALEYGMPPAGGVGIGIDRLVMLLTDTHNIREVIFFPTLKPRQ